MERTLSPRLPGGLAQSRFIIPESPPEGAAHAQGSLDEGDPDSPQVVAALRRLQRRRRRRVKCVRPGRRAVMSVNAHQRGWRASNCCCSQFRTSRIFRRRPCGPQLWMMRTTLDARWRARVELDRQLPQGFFHGRAARFQSISAHRRTGDSGLRAPGTGAVSQNGQIADCGASPPQVPQVFMRRPPLPGGADAAAAGPRGAGRQGR